MNTDPVIGYIYKVEVERKRGLISVDGDPEFYRFYNDDLQNCNIRTLQEGDTVEFVPYENLSKGKLASNVRLLSQSDADNSIPNAGFGKFVSLDQFNKDEKKIVENLAKIFYVTTGATEISLSNSTYRYCFIKPTSFFVHNFQLTREVIVVFSDYVLFEPRTLDAAQSIKKNIPTKLRLEKGCHIVISHDKQVEAKLYKYLRDNNVDQIVIPFTYEELLDGNTIENIVQERFRKCLFDSDLFNTSAAIRDENFFFGRRALVHDIVSKCKHQGHCGVFGLRRSGKTSVLYQVQSLLQNEGYTTVFIPCQGHLNTLDWRMALYTVVKDIYKALGYTEDKIEKSILQSNYDSFNTAIFFEKDLNRTLEILNKPIILMFDEIEAITFSVNGGYDSENLWMDGVSFIHFWNAIRGYYTQYPARLSIVVAGTNPMINEEPAIGRKKETNPMFKQLSIPNSGEYLQAFGEEDTANMVNTLGSYMGLTFDRYSIGRLVNDCGGHPYLMRMLCSYINKHIKQKPIEITRAIYDNASAEFEKSRDAIGYFGMILNILETSYPKEYETLKILATQGDDIISKVQDNNALHHLLGYGLIEESQGNYAIKFDTIKRYLNEQYKFERTDLDVSEQSIEINLRMGNAERALRILIKTTLRAILGKTRAKQVVLSAMENTGAGEYSVRRAVDMEYEELFDSSINNIYFKCLQNIIVNHFDVFRNIFDGCTSQDLDRRLTILNRSRRCPAHAYDEGAENWTLEDFKKYRESMSWLERYLSEFN